MTAGRWPRRHGLNLCSYPFWRDQPYSSTKIVRRKSLVDMVPCYHRLPVSAAPKIKVTVLIGEHSHDFHLFGKTIRRSASTVDCEADLEWTVPDSLTHTAGLLTNLGEIVGGLEKGGNCEITATYDAPWARHRSRNRRNPSS